MRHRAAAVVLALVTVAVAACGATTAAATGDEIGVVDNVSYDDEFAFDEPLDDDELDILVSRSMARVEHLRERGFERRPNVEIVERDDVPTADTEVNRTPAGDWNDMVWKALLVVGEDEYANQVIADTFGGATEGFFEPGNETDDTASVSLVGDVDEPTLAHELVHVMQDERYNLSSERLSPPVQDEQLSTQGVIEGEADYIRFLYAERCADDWDCYTGSVGGTDGAGDTDAAGISDTNIAVLMTVFQPYSDGPQYVHELVEEGGWDALDDAFDDPPTASREIIHREPHERPDIDFEDEATAGWLLYDEGRDGYDIAGEASVFVTFWYQSDAVGYGLDVIDTSGFASSDEPYSRNTYVSDVSQGLAADRIYPYHRERAGENETGYVWLTRWDTEDDARTFADAYTDVLEGHDAELIDETTLSVEGDFRGAYRVVRDAENVTIVHAPTTDALDEIRPSVSETDRYAGAIDARPLEPRPLNGMGVVAALAAVLAVLLARRR